jgi:hypothetical protein
LAVEAFIQAGWIAGLAFDDIGISWAVSGKARQIRNR